MKILAVDQARHGAWAVYDYEGKKLLDYGTWGFDSKNYTFEQAILHIEALLSEVIRTHDIDAVFLEDIQLRKNVQSFKKLAQLQGVLVNMCEKTNILYTGKKTSKILSLQAARDIYGIVTENDNLADATMIGHYVVNNIKIGSEDDFNEKERDDQEAHGGV